MRNELQKPSCRAGVIFLHIDYKVKCWAIYGPLMLLLFSASSQKCLRMLVLKVAAQYLLMFRGLLQGILSHLTFISK